MMHEHAGPMEIRIEGELGPDTDIKELLEQVTDEIGGLFPSHENKKKESSMNALEQYHNLRTAGYSPEESDHIVRFASNTILTSDIERMQKTAAGMINNSIYDNGPDPGSNMRIPWARTMIGGPGYNAMRIGQGPVNDPGFSGPYNNSISQRMVGPVRDDPGSNGGIPWAGQGLGISTQEWNAAHPGETPAENARSYQREVAQYMHNPYNTYPQQPYNMNPSSFFPQQTNQPYPSMNPNSFYPPPWSLGGGLNFGALGGLANGIGAAGRAVGDGIGAAGRAVGDLAGAVGPAVGKGLLGVGNTAAGVADIGGAILGAPNAVNNLNGAPFSAPGNSNFNPLGLKF
jgi:hypothetical protein